ncbi:MAG: hypothetical protein K2W96_22000, partial [Gemmataceae bacterium]|nr:hypothetical protein [Gemmataceae bacterium]
MANRDRLSPGGAAGPSWETWFQAATTEQRQQALALARASGHVPARLLPAFDRAGKPTLLARLLAGEEAAPLADAPDFDPFDAALDACQRQAVARSLASPDLSLVVGPAGT